MIALRAAFGDLFCPPSFVKNSEMSAAVIAFCNSSESVSPVFPFKHKGTGWTARCEFLGAGARLLSSQRKMVQYLSWFLEVLCPLKRWQRFGGPDWLLMMEETSHKSNHKRKAQGAGWEMGTGKNPQRGRFPCFSSECGASEEIPFPGIERCLWNLCYLLLCKGLSQLRQAEVWAPVPRCFCSLLCEQMLRAGCSLLFLAGGNSNKILSSTFRWRRVWVGCF